MKKQILIIIILLIILAGITGYFQIVKNPEPTKEKLSDVLNVYNWEDYFGETTIEDFENEFGVKVNLATFENEDEMLSAIQSNPRQYDVTVASDILVKEMINMKLLTQLNIENISNFKNIGSEFKNPSYDPGNKYSVTYLWSTSGLAINRKYIKEIEPSWSILWNPEYKGKISMLNNMQDVLGSALFYLGHSGNSINPTELEEAKNLLLKQKPLLRGYEDTITIRDDLISEKLWAGHIYSGDGAFAAAENENIEYIIPQEGAFITLDNLVVPIGAQHKYTAEVFINFILRPDVSAKLVNYLWYANTNEAAREFTDPAILQNASIYPSEEVKKNLEFSGYFGGVEALALYNQIWAELQHSE